MAQYAFELTDPDLQCLQVAELQQKLVQWGLADSLKGIRCRYTGRFSPNERDSFFRQLFGCKEVVASLDVSKPPGSSVKTEALACTVLSMDLFDQLVDSGECGHFRSIEHHHTETTDQ